jgi:hypothetical protein
MLAAQLWVRKEPSGSCGSEVRQVAQSSPASADLRLSPVAELGGYEPDPEAARLPPLP